MRTPLLLLTAVVALAACTEAPDSPAEPDVASTHTEHTTDPSALTPVAPRMEDGVQTVAIEAGPMGYQPGAVSLQAGIPARLVFTRTVDSECSSQVTVPDFDVPPTDLPMNEPVAIEFTPTEDGDFSFVCGMEMQRGTLVVQA